MLQLDLVPYTLHFRKPAATSRGALQERALWVVQAWESTQPALRGRGEAALVPGLSIDDSPTWHAACHVFVAEFNRQQVTMPQASHVPLERVTQVLAPFAEQLTRLPSLRFGVECALLDLLQGAQGLYFASDFVQGAYGLPTHGLIWMDDLDGMLDQIERKLRAGFGVLKMKVGVRAWEQELSFVKAIRQGAPAIELRLDANGAYTKEQARTVVADLRDLEIAYIEEPLAFAEFADLAELVAESPVPIGLDETLLRALPSGNAEALLDDLRPKHIILKPALLGGFASTLSWIAAAEARGSVWWLNSLLESAIGHSAICQFAGWLRTTQGDARVHGLGTGSLFGNNFASPIALRGHKLWWVGAQRLESVG